MRWRSLVARDRITGAYFRGELSGISRRRNNVSLAIFEDATATCAVTSEAHGDPDGRWRGAETQSSEYILSIDALDGRVAKPKTRKAASPPFGATHASYCGGTDILAAAEKAGLREPDVTLLLSLLINAGIIAPARSDHANVDRSPSERLNRVLMQTTVSADTHRFLASPVLGSALSAPFLDRVIAPEILKRADASHMEIASLAFETLDAAGQHFHREGKAMAKTDQNVADIGKLVQEFREFRLPRCARTWYRAELIASYGALLQELLLQRQVRHQSLCRPGADFTVGSQLLRDEAISCLNRMVQSGRFVATK